MYGAVKCDLALPCATQNELLLERCKGSGCQWLPGCMRRCKHADYSGCYRVSAEKQRDLRTGQSCQRRRCCYLRSGNVPEQRAFKLSLRRSRCQTAADHDQYLPQCRRCCKALRYGRQLCSRRKHCRIRKSCRCYERTGYCLIFQYPLYKKRTGEQTKWFVPQLFY